MLETTYEQKWLYMLSLKLHFVKTQKFSFTTLIEIIFSELLLCVEYFELLILFDELKEHETFAINFEERGIADSE